MSLPKIPPSHSSSPSKSSLRSTSGDRPQKPDASRSLLPSPHFEEPPPQSPLNANLEYEVAIEEAAPTPTPTPADDGPTLSPSFRPFFTLIEDTLTQAHHHPTVHYIFADDDTDIVTEAACRSLLQDDPSMANTSADQDPQSSASVEQEEEKVEEESKLPAPADGVREHYLLLDLHPSDAESTSYTVTRAHSLSPDWQILSTGVTSAPTIDAGGPEDDDDTAGGGGSSEGLMLRIEGQGFVAADGEHHQHQHHHYGAAAGKGKMKKTKAEKETLEDMVARFEKGLADIRRAIDAGGPVGSV